MSSIDIDIRHEKIPGLKIANPRAVFRGLTYGDWAGVWMNNLFSDYPEVQPLGQKGMVFLRGNVEYATQDDPEHAIFSQLTMTKSIRIEEDTAVLIPIINTYMVIEYEYTGQLLKNTLSIRSIARRDTVEGGPIGIKIKYLPEKREKDRNYDEEFPLVDNLDDFYVESPVFTLDVPENSQFRTAFRIAREVGTYQCVTAGVFVIINKWPAGKFRLAVLGTGVGGYETKSVYDIDVTPKGRKLLDISEFGLGKPKEYSAPDPLKIMGRWEDPKATL